MKDKILVVVITKAWYVEICQNTILLIKKRYGDVKIITSVKLFNIIQSRIVQIIQKSNPKNLLNYKTSIADNSKLIEGN